MLFPGEGSKLAGNLVGLHLLHVIHQRSLVSLAKKPASHNVHVKS